MSKRPARDEPRSTDPDLEEHSEARNWDAAWRAVFGEDAGERLNDDEGHHYEDEDDELSVQIERSVRCAAMNLVDHFKSVLDDPGSCNYSRALDPETLLKLLLCERTCEFAIDEAIISLKASSPARERWPDPYYWDVKAKLELELTLEAMIPSERPSVGPESLRYSALLRTLPAKAREIKAAVRRQPASVLYERQQRRRNECLGLAARRRRRSHLRHCVPRPDDENQPVTIA